MRLFRVFIRAQSEFLFRCYSDPYAAQTVRLAVKASRLAGIGTLWAVWRGRREEPYFYEYESGYYSAEGERKAALEALRLPPDWIFNERDLAGARASSPERTLQAILSLLEYQYGYERKKEFERMENSIRPGQAIPDRLPEPEGRRSLPGSGRE
jgi:hypothetical protein